MLQERNFPTFLTKLTPAPKLWFALGLILANILLKNLYFSIAVIIVSVVMIIKEKHMGLFKLILVTMVVMAVSMYGIHGAMAPVIDKASDPVLFQVFGIRYYAKGFAYASRYFMRAIPLMCALFLIFLSIDMTDLGVTMCKAGISYNFVFTFVDSFQVITLLRKDTLPIAFMLAFLLSKSTRINAVSQSIIFTPTIMSSAVMALIFYLLFNTYNGEINRFLMWLGVIDENINWLGVQHAMLTVIILAVWGGVGNYMVYFIAGLTGISTDVYESAKLDGANGAQTLFRITIPLLAPVLKMILMLALVISFMDMQSIMVLTEGGPMGKTNVMFLYIYQLFFPISAGSTVTQEFGYGAAVSLVAACIIGLITGLYLFIGGKLDKVTGE